MRAGRNDWRGRITLLAGMVALGGAAAARAQSAPDPSAKAWEDHIHTAAAVSMPGTGDLSGPTGGEADLGREGPWEVRNVPGKTASETNASGSPKLDQTRPFAAFGLGALGGLPATSVTDRTSDPAIKPTGVDLARQRPTLEHGSFNLSGDGRSFGLDTWTTSTWNTSARSSFNF